MPIVDTTLATTKKITWANVKATLKTYFDTLYATLASPTFTGTVTIPTALISGLTASELVATDASKQLQSLAVATYPSLTELSYVKGVTSAVQTQLAAKAPSTAPTFATSITGSYLTASEILVTDALKNIVSAAVATYPSLTELTYVKGVTSAIQTQFSGKAGLSSANAFTVGGQTITVADTTNVKGLVIYMNDTTNDPLGLQVGPDATKVTASTLVQYNAVSGDNSDWAFNMAGSIGTNYPSASFQNTGGTLGTPTATVAGRIYTIESYIYNSTPLKKLVSKVGASLVDGTAASEDAKLTWGVITAGTLADELELTGAALYPTTSDGLALGSGTKLWSDLFLASASVIDFNNGDVTLTHGANVLTLGGGDLALGANNLTVTGSIAATGARVTKGWFTDLESTNMPTVGGTALLTSLTAPQFTTIELGHATDTTLARVSAGVVSIEGVSILTTAGGTLTGNITLGEGADPATIGIVMDASMSADERYSGITVPGTAGATLAFGDLCYLDVTATKWLLADASAAATAGSVVLGICVDASIDTNATSMLLIGTVRSAAFPASIALGAPVYVSETAGDVTATQPTTTDSVIRVCGFAVTAEPNTIYFNPSSDFITHT